MKKKNKNYVAVPNEMADTALIRARNLIKEKPPFYEEPRKDGGTPVEIKNHSPMKSLEFNSVGLFYLEDAATYLSTHHSDELEETMAYFEGKLTLEYFFEITIGKYEEQRERLMYEIKRSSRRAYIPKSDGGYYIMPPFRVDFESDEKEVWTENWRKKLKNLKNFKDKVDIPTTKVSHVLFSIAKPIFERYSKEQKGYHRCPKNLYATIYDKLKDASKINIGKGLKAGEDYHSEINYKERLTSNEFLGAYMRAIHYLYRHGAGTQPRITIDKYDFFNHVIPRLIRGEEENWRVRDREEGYDFITAMINLINVLDLDYKIIISDPKDSNDKEKWIFELSHPERVKKEQEKKKIKQLIKEAIH